jgi:tetratricopeptide (TPR) repeat protein
MDNSSAQDIRCNTNCIKSLPQDVVAKAFAYCRRGDAYLARGDFRRAVADYSRALRLTSISVDARRGRSYAYFKLAIADLEEAKVLGHQSAEQQGSLAALYYNLGLVHQDLGDYPGSIRAFTEAIRYNPQNGDAYFARGNARQRTVSSDVSDTSPVSDPQAEPILRGALEDFTQALRLGITRGPTSYRVGLLSMRLGDLAVTVDSLREATRDPTGLAPADVTSARKLLVSACHDRGRNSLETGDCDQAIADLNEAVALEPSNKSLLQDLARAYTHKCEPELAINIWTKVLTLAPDDAESYKVRGWLWAAIGRTDKAQADWQRVIQLAPNQTNSYEAWSQSEAEPALAKAVEFWEMHYDNGYDMTASRVRPRWPQQLLDLLGNRIAIRRAAIVREQLDDGDVESAMTKVTTLIREKNYKDAVANLDAVADKWPATLDNPKYWEKQGVCLQELGYQSKIIENAIGRYKQALIAFENSARLSSDILVTHGFPSRAWAMAGYHHLFGTGLIGDQWKAALQALEIMAWRHSEAFELLKSLGGVHMDAWVKANNIERSKARPSTVLPQKHQLYEIADWLRSMSPDEEDYSDGLTSESGLPPEELIKRAAAEDSDRSKRARAVALLGALACPRSVAFEMVRSFATDTRFYVRAMALYGMMECILRVDEPHIPDSDAKSVVAEALTILCGDRSFHPQRMAAYVLGRIAIARADLLDISAVISKLRERVGNERWAVRFRAVEALGRLTEAWENQEGTMHEAAYDSLAVAVADDDIDVKLAAIESLGRLRNHKAEVVRTLEHLNPQSFSFSVLRRTMGTFGGNMSYTEGFHYIEVILWQALARIHSHEQSSTSTFMDKLLKRARSSKSHGIRRFALDAILNTPLCQVEKCRLLVERMCMDGSIYNCEHAKTILLRDYKDLNPVHNWDLA